MKTIAPCETETTSSREVVVDSLSVQYPRGVLALDGVDLRIGPGLFGLLGPNGAGKTTLMRTLATLQRPTRGGATLQSVGDTEAGSAGNKVTLPGFFATQCFAGRYRADVRCWGFASPPGGDSLRIDVTPAP